jgi:hypothetical protein
MEPKNFTRRRRKMDRTEKGAPPRDVGQLAEDHLRACSAVRHNVALAFHCMTSPKGHPSRIYYVQRSKKAFQG